jgi:hypothetical protein
MKQRASRPNCPRIDLTAYGGQWVALDPATNRVVGHAVSLQDAEQTAVQQGVLKPLLVSVPASDGFFVGLGG